MGIIEITDSGAIESVTLVLLFGAIFVFHIGSYVWVCRDAALRGVTSGLPDLMTFLMGPMGLFMWLFTRPPLQAEKEDDPNASIQ